MNWYKLAQGIEIIEREDHSHDYGDVGHDWYYGYDDDYEAGNYNYMWIFIDGKVDAEIETDQTDCHAGVERWSQFNEIWSRLYSGRYDTSRNMISIVKPTEGVASFRGIPNAVQYALKQEFPNAEHMYVY